MENISTKVLIIGGGPGGYVAAIRCAQLGLPTVLVEEAKLGGTCLNVGCIPSKALIHAADAFHDAKSSETASAFGLMVKQATLDLGKAVSWKNGIVERLSGGVGSLLKKNGVRAIQGRAEFVDGKACVVRNSATDIAAIRCEHLVLATGSIPAQLRTLPFGEGIVSSTEALSPDAVPSKLAVVGAGYIGMELGTAYAKLGSQVTIVEAADRILPTWDEELTKPVAKAVGKLGVSIQTKTRALGRDPTGTKLRLTNGNAPQEFILETDLILVAAGRIPNTVGFGLERLGLAMGTNSVKVDDRCETSMRNVWAIGDITGEPMLAHRAMAQGELVAEVIAGERRTFDFRSIPAVCFTEPQIVSVGLSPADAGQSGETVKVSKFPFAGNGRALTQNDDAGFIRVVSDTRSEVVLGIQAVGKDVAELSSAFSVAIEMCATLQDLARTIQAHPTRGEALQEAALAGLGGAIHA